MNKKTILFIGHDLKFLKLIVSHFSEKEEYEVKTFTYAGHNIRDHKALAQLLPGVDLIFCEWGLGNLNWLSKNKFADQKLIVRVHSQEFRTQHLKETYWLSVDRILFVGPHMKVRFDDLFPGIKLRSKLIYNVVDTDSFAQRKNIEAIYQIGLLGILPKSKAPHLGLELLVELIKHSSDFKLNIKSKRPEELSWVWENEEEKKYYENFYQSIEKLNFQDSVIFDPHGSDVQEWFRNIGFIFSPSEFESFHMAIPEGMASGAIPVIRNWQGADMIYPKKFIFKDIQQAAGIILKYQDKAKRNAASENLKAYAKNHFGLDVILGQYEQLFDEVLQSQQICISSPQLRGIYSQLHQEQTTTIDSLKAKDLQRVETLNGLQKQIEEKESLIAEFSKSDKNHKQTIEVLSQEITERNRKVDSIIAVADEMKLQLAESRLREKEKDNTIALMKDEQSKNMQETTDLKAKATEIVQAMNIQTEREKLKDSLIESLRQDNEKRIQELVSVKGGLDVLNQQMIHLTEREKEKDSQIVALLEEREKLERSMVSAHSEIEKSVHRVKELEVKEQQQELQMAALQENKEKLEQDAASLVIVIDSMKAQLRSFEKAIKDQETIIKEQATVIEKQTSVIKDQESAIRHQESAIADFESKTNALNSESVMLTKKIVEKDMYISEIITKSEFLKKELLESSAQTMKQCNQIEELLKKSKDLELLISNLKIQTKDHQQYIQYLEKRFLNKIIGIVRQRFSGS